ncbi:MAG: hypothetical protein ACJ77M_17390 [Thermoleophilaceae bacterium]
MGVKEKDANAVERVLDEARALYNGGPDFDMRRVVLQLFERCPTPDLRELRAEGISGESFYRQEIAPNWDELDRGERAAKIEAFARFANVIARAEGDDAAAGMGPVVRTKVVVLAWAFDSLYRDDYLERIVNDPVPFGEIEVGA